nr:Chain S, uL30m [Leishmania major]
RRCVMAKGEDPAHVAGWDDRQDAVEWWWTEANDSRGRQRLEAAAAVAAAAASSTVGLPLFPRFSPGRRRRRRPPAPPPPPPPLFLSRHLHSMPWLWCTCVKMQMYYTPTALTCPLSNSLAAHVGHIIVGVAALLPYSMLLFLTVMCNPRKHEPVLRAQRIRWLTFHSLMFRLLRCITASPAVAASVAVAAAQTPTSLRPAAVCRRGVHLAPSVLAASAPPPPPQQQQQPTSAAVPASTATSTTTIAAGPYRRVGNVFIVTCIDHPFKFSWEVNRMLRELRLEFMGQTTVVPDIPPVRKRIWRVRHVVRVDQLDLDEAKALIGIPEHISFRDLAGQIPPTFGRGGSVANPHMRSKMNFMRLRRMRLRDVMHRDQLEKRLLEERHHALQQQQQQQQGGGEAAAAAAATTA